MQPYYRRDGNTCGTCRHWSVPDLDRPPAVGLCTRLSPRTPPYTDPALLPPPVADWYKTGPLEGCGQWQELIITTDAEDLERVTECVRILSSQSGQRPTRDRVLAQMRETYGRGVSNNRAGALITKALATLAETPPDPGDGPPTTIEV